MDDVPKKIRQGRAQGPGRTPAVEEKVAGNCVICVVQNDLPNEVKPLQIVHPVCPYLVDLGDWCIHLPPVGKLRSILIIVTRRTHQSGSALDSEGHLTQKNNALLFKNAMHYGGGKNSPWL